ALGVLHQDDEVVDLVVEVGVLEGPVGERPERRRREPEAAVAVEGRLGAEARVADDHAARAEELGEVRLARVAAQVREQRERRVRSGSAPGARRSRSAKRSWLAARKRAGTWCAPSAPRTSACAPVAVVSSSTSTGTRATSPRGSWNACRS